MSRGKILGIVALIVALAGAYLVRRHLHWRKGVPNITLKDEERRAVTLDDVRGRERYLVLVFLASDPGSAHSAAIVSQAAQRKPPGVAFAGVLLDGSAGAQTRGPGAFPVYTAEPDAVAELIRALGPPPDLVRVGFRRHVERQPGAGITGGTVVSLDASRRLLEQAESGEVTEFVDRVLVRVE